MAQGPLENTFRVYFHPERRWTVDPEGATLRLDATSLERKAIEARNVLYAADGKGGWRAISRESALDGLSRGLVWETWATAVDGEVYYAFRGLRVVDEELADGLLAGLPLRDEEGRLATEPRRLGRVFLLDEAHAAELARRLKDADGVLSWGNPLSEGSQTALERLGQIAARVGEERAKDSTVLRDARTGNLAGVADFEARTKAFLTLAADTAEAYAECKRQVRHLLAQGKTLEERETAAAHLQEARLLRDGVTVAREERDEDAAELALRAGIAAGRAIDSPSPNLQLAARAIGRLADEAGYQVEQDHGTTVIHLPGATLRLGQSFDYLPGEEA